MIVIPTLELRGGVCVRAAGPDGSGEAIPVGDAFAVMRNWATAGFQQLHVVDLDAERGQGSNAMLLEELLRTGGSGSEIQTAGGVESGDQIDRFLDAGATWVAVSTRGVEELDWLAGVAETFPGAVIVAVRVRDRRVAVRGWGRASALDIMDLVEELNAFPLGGLIVSTPHLNDPRPMQELALLEDLAEEAAFPLMVEGGVTSMNDLRALEHRGVSAVLPGAVLYSGVLDARAVAQEFC